MGTLWYGGLIYTLQDEDHVVEAILTEKDRIIAMGNVEKLEQDFAHMIQDKFHLHGRTLLPGFVDSHIHLIGHGEKLMRLNLSTYTSKADVLMAIKEYASSLNEGEWIIGEGWNENLWGDAKTIDRNDIDMVVPHHPVLLKRICRHVLVVNSFALQEASIQDEMDTPQGGVIEKDEEGKLTGVFKEKAQDMMLDAVPNASEEQLKKALRMAIKDAYEKGLTGVHTEDLSYYNGFENTYQLFKDVIEKEEHYFRAHLLVHYSVLEDFKRAGGQFLQGNQWIEFGAMKIFADGSLGGRTALLSHPYADDPETSGVAIYTQEELNELVAKAREIRMPVAIHAIGDKAFEMVVQAIEAHPLVGNGKDRIIHAQILRKELIDRVKKLPVILDIQPSFLASDFPWVIDRIGEGKLDYCYAWKTLLSEQLTCAGGSDAPIEEVSPLLGIHAAVARVSQQTQEVYQPEEALSTYEAVCLYTKGSASAACHEVDRGIIKEGFLADFTILDQDIFHCAPHEIRNINVESTVIGGKPVYTKITEGTSPTQTI
ncbi:amidohydrolase [Robertmurraya massiliosenegalensis]|uniref:amidohydrolase n=1 Tax=Robertmurraya TaxID=2837507 RepID=UPI0039A5AD09